MTAAGVIEGEGARTEYAALGGAGGLGVLHARIACRFRRPEVRVRARRYLEGLLGLGVGGRTGPLERRNGWQLAEHLGEGGPQGVQRLLNAARWDAGAVRDDLRKYVVERLGDPGAVLVVDETGFVKKGSKSAGVARQYSGTAGRIENCQIGVFLAYASPEGIAFLDRALYLPRVWAADAARRQEARIPPHVRFATKGALAKAMLQRAFAAEVPAAWVAADAVYGADGPLRRWLEEQGRAYVLAVPHTHRVWVPARVTEQAGNGRVDEEAGTTGARPRPAGRLAAALPAAAWARHSAGDGSQGPRWYDWVAVPLAGTQEDATAGMARWLLVRRSASDARELAYFRAYGPAATPLEGLVRVAGSRWAIECGFEQAKGEVGLGEYEVRGWDAWHRHVTLALLAHAHLAVTRSEAAVPQTATQKGAAPRLAPAAFCSH